MVRTARTLSRKWVSRRAAQTMVSIEASRSGAYSAHRIAPYKSAAATTTTVIIGLRMNMMTSVMLAISPSSSASTRSIVSACWITSIEPKRDTMSPSWRDSKKPAGRLCRWVNRLLRPCSLSVADSTISIQPRIVVKASCSSISRANPSASVSSRSRSALIRALSTTSWMKNGCSSMKTSIASASANSCPSERLKPITRPTTSVSFRRGGAATGLKRCVGVSSRATPEKWSETCCSVIRR